MRRLCIAVSLCASLTLSFPPAPPKGHILVKVADGKSRRVGCMGFKCPYACPERQVLGLVRATGKVEIAEKYELSLEQSYVEDNARSVPLSLCVSLSL